MLQRFQCPDCNKLFMQKSTLVEHQAVAHRPQQDSAPPPSQPAQTTEDDPDDPPVVDTVKADEAETETPLVVTSVETVKKEPANVIKKLADDWDEDMETDAKPEGDNVESVESEASKPVPDVATEITKKPTRQSIDKSEEVDEDQIVADVDDILKDTENIMSDADAMLSKKKDKVTEPSKSPVDDEDGGVIKSLVDKKGPTEQCEECYECFEDKEKLAWHNLNDH